MVWTEMIMKMTFEKFQKKLTVVVLASAVALAGTTLAFTRKSAEKTKPGPAALNVPLD